MYSSNETAGTITIASMTVTTIFGCRGRNEAGLGPLVQSYIGVIPRGKLAIAAFYRYTSD